MISFLWTMQSRHTYWSPHTSQTILVSIFCLISACCRGNSSAETAHKFACLNPNMNSCLTATQPIVFFFFSFFFYMKNYTPKVFSPCCLRAQLLSSLASMLPFFHPSSCYSIHILLNYFSILFQGQALNAFTLSSALFEFLNQPKLFQDAHVTQPAPLVTAFKLPYQHLFYLSLSLSSFPFFLSCPWPLPSFLGMCTLVMHKLSFN